MTAPTFTSMPALPTLSRRAVLFFLVAGVLLAGLLVAPFPPTATAQPALPQSSSQALQDANAAARDGAWELRGGVHDQVGQLPPELAGSSRDGIDAAVDGLFPGLIDERTHPSAPEQTPPPQPAPAAFDRGSCPPSARSCVDLAGKRTWLQQGGQVSYGPVPIAIGRLGQETPRGTHYVTRKVRDEVSYEFNNAPMPYSVYFTNNGHAFHEGDLGTGSAGCIRLNHADAVTYFNTLQIGDMVHIY